MKTHFALIMSAAIASLALSAPMTSPAFAQLGTSRCQLMVGITTASPGTGRRRVIAITTSCEPRTSFASTTPGDRAIRRNLRLAIRGHIGTLTQASAPGCFVISGNPA